MLPTQNASFIISGDQDNILFLLAFLQRFKFYPYVLSQILLLKKIKNETNKTAEHGFNEINTLSY